MVAVTLTPATLTPPTLTPPENGGGGEGGGVPPDVTLMRPADQDSRRIGVKA